MTMRHPSPRPRLFRAAALSALMLASWAAAPAARAQLQINEHYDIEGNVHSAIDIGSATTAYFTVNLFSGTVFTSGGGYSIRTHNYSILAMWGGATSDRIVARGHSDVYVMGGTAGGLNLAAHDESTVSVAGGAVSGYFSAYGNSRAFLRAGTVGMDLNTQENATAHVFGGTIGRYLYAGPGTSIDFFGGRVNDSVGTDGGVVNVYGGYAANGYFARAGGVINFFGPDLTRTRVGTTSAYRIAGTLTDGSFMDRTFDTAGGGGFNVHFAPAAAPVPELGTIAGLGALLSLGGLGILRARGRRRRD